MTNPVVHFEVGVKDGKAGQEFYSNLFEWSINAEHVAVGKMLYDAIKYPKHSRPARSARR